jgi:hypothetical protein
LGKIDDADLSMTVRQHGGVKFTNIWKVYDRVSNVVVMILSIHKAISRINL